MKSGFTIIEFIIGLTISSIILMIVLASFFNINSVLNVAQDIITLDTRAAIVQNQLQKDLNGAFVPVQAQESPAKDPKERKKPMTDVFLSKNKDNQLSMLTFISNNPIVVYSKNRIPKIRVARIVYRLVPEETKKNSFKLLRQEGQELDLAAYDLKTGKVKAYELATLVKKITVEYKIPKPPSQDKKEKTIEFGSSKEWPREKKEKEGPLIPQFVTITMDVWDNEQREERSATFNIEIPAWSMTFTKVQELGGIDKESKQKTETGPELTPAMMAQLKDAMKQLLNTGTVKA